MVSVFKGAHGSLVTTSDCVGLPLRVGTGRIGLEKLWAVFVHTANEEGNTVGTSHWLSLLTLVALSKVNSEVRDSLSDRLDSHGLIKVERVVLGLDSSVVDQDSCVAHDTAHGTRAVTINLYELLTWFTGFHQN